MLAMVLTVILLLWTAGRVTGLVADQWRAGSAGRSPTVGRTLDGEAGERVVDDGTVSGAGLRNDLFKAPASRKAARKQEPKTNPLELLNLIELQGVMGGDRPRAMIKYKSTGETITVSVGDDLGEFEVMDILVRSVVLQWRDELFELSL